MGSHDELSAAELAAFTAELEDIEAGDWVQTDAIKGIAVSMPDDGKVDVDIYEKIDGTWRSVEEVNTYSINSLEEWDVDEDSVGGAVEKDEEENRHNLMVPSMQFYSKVNDSLLTVVTVEGDRVLMESEGESSTARWYEPIQEVYRGMAEGNLDYHDPDDEMPLIMSGMKFYSTTNSSVQQVMRVEGDMVQMSTMDYDSSWMKPKEELIEDLAEGELRVFHPKDEVEGLAPVSSFVFDNKEDAMEIVEEDQSGILTDVHSHEVEGETTYMPGADMDEFTRWHKNKHDKADMSSAVPPYAHFLDEEELDSPKHKRGDWVSWNTRNSTEKGTVYGSYMEGEDLPDFRGDRGMSPEGDEVLYALRMYKERDGTWHPIEGGLIGHYEKSVSSIDEPADVSDSPVELEDGLIDEPVLESGMMVHWQANPNMVGKIVHVPEDDDIVMVELHDFEDGELVSTGYTVTAGYGDVQRMRSDMLGNAAVSRHEEHLEALEDEIGTQSLARLAAEPMVSRPEAGDARALVHTPIEGDFDGDDVQEVVDMAEDELGTSISVEMTEEGIMFGPQSMTGAGETEFLHLHLDVMESAAKNVLGIAQKSTLFAAGEVEGHSIQPCFKTDEKMPEPILREIARLYKFVTGIDANLYYLDDKLSFDTGEVSMNHVALDIAEILARRMGDENDITVETNSFAVLPEADVSERVDSLGRSNVSQYDVEAEQWVQWYPTDTTEAHGFSVSVDGDSVEIEKWEQDSDGKWATDGDTVTKDMEEVEPWGNFPREQEDFADAIEDGDPRKNPAQGPQRREGSDVNPEGSAASASAEHLDDDITFSDSIEKGLKNKVEEHNEEHGDDEGKRVTYRMLKSVYRRGAGAYSDSHREGMTRQQWSYARVNAFLYLVRNGNPENDNYTQDNDLLPDEHPKYNDSEEAAVTSGDVPVQDAPPTHDTSVKSLVLRFMEETDIDEPSLSDLTEWMADNVEALSRKEAQEKVIDSKIDLENIRDEQPHRFVDAEDESSAELEELYEDYPQAAVENAQMALDAKEDTGNPRGCGTRVGWIRAQQLADEEPISRDIIARMSSFNRHRQNSEMDEDEGKTDCGWMMWNAWGGDEGVDWAQSKLQSIEEAAMADVPEEHQFKSPEDAAEMAPELGMTGSHEIDGMWIPGESHEEYMDNVVSAGYYEDASADEGKNTNTTNLNKILSDVEALEDYEMHDPSYEGTTEESWSSPTLEEIMEGYGFDEDFDSYQSLPQDAKETIGDHFFISMSGFPAENFGDYKLPVVTTDGKLSLNALNAVKGGRGVSAVAGLNSEMEDAIVKMANELANEEFDKDYSMDEMMDMEVPMDMRYESEEDAMDAAEDMGISGAHMMMFDGKEMYVPGSTHQALMDAVSSMGGYSSMGYHGMDGDMEDDDEEMQEQSHSIEGTTGRPTVGTQERPGGVRVLSGDDLWQAAKSEESDVGSLTEKTITNMTSDIEDMLSELDQPVAVEAAEVEQLREKADRFEEMSDSLEALRERTDILDSVEQSLVEELAEADDAIVVESARFEELEAEAAQVKGIYAEELAEEYPAFTADELTGKFSIEELREKYEAEIGDVESLATSTDAQPRSQDADEESLEDAAEEDTETEELSDSIAEKQAELKKSILGGN